MTKLLIRLYVLVGFFGLKSKAFLNHHYQQKIPNFGYHYVRLNGIKQSDSEEADADTSEIQYTGVRVNVAVRELLHFLTKTYGTTEGSWIKARSYLYRSSDKLSILQVKQVIQYLQEIFPNDIELQRLILQSSPRILRKNVRTNLRPTAEFLMEFYGDELFREAARRNPNLLLTTGVGYKGDGIDLVEIFLAKEVGLSPAAISRLKRSAPFFFQLPMSRLLESINFISSFYREAGYDDTEKINSFIGKLISSHSTIFQLSVTDNLKPRIDYLKERCNLESKDVTVLLRSSSASVLGLSVERNLKPTIEFLSKVLAPNDLRKCILSHPQLLGLSLANLEAKANYFDAIDNASGSTPDSHNSLSSRILKRAPAVFSLSLPQNIIPTVNFLAGIWGVPAPQCVPSGQDILSCITTDVPLDNDSLYSLSALLSEYPSILTLSLEGNIQPTVNFYNRTGYINIDEKWQLKVPSEEDKVQILRGRYIAASLFLRLLPRWHYYMSIKGMDDCDIGDSTPIPLHVLVNKADSDFCRQYNLDEVEYQKFKTEAAPRLKFASQFDTWRLTGRPIDI